MATSKTTVSERAVKVYLDALTAKERADELVSDAKEALIKAFASDGINEVACDEVTVAVSPRERRSWDLTKLKKLVSPALFRKVTKPTVDTGAWDSATEKGEIPTKTIRSVVEVTEYVAVLVKPTKGAEKPKTAKV
jgi:hypothetical protein